jgi:hypothetical protein
MLWRDLWRPRSPEDKDSHDRHDRYTGTHAEVTPAPVAVEPRLHHAPSVTHRKDPGAAHHVRLDMVHLAETSRYDIQVQGGVRRPGAWQQRLADKG